MLRLALAVLLVLAGAAQAKAEKAILAGGCFWCVEADFESVPGVSRVVSGYTGGSMKDPAYEDVSSGGTGHYEAVEIIFDPARISYAELVAKFLRSVDVTDAGGQFCDRGDSYRTAIFVSNAAQKAAATAAVTEAEAVLGRKIVTPILSAKTFWPAEGYHQNYYKGSNIVITRAGPKRQSNAYKFYRNACGRDARVKAIWGAEAAFAH